MTTNWRQLLSTLILGLLWAIAFFAVLGLVWLFLTDMLAVLS